MDSEQDNHVIKLMMLGDTSVGKTSLVLRYTEGTYTSNYISTLGVDFKTKEIDVDGRKFQVQVWDTAGQERFRALTSSYFHGANGFLLVCDLTEKLTFESLNTWYENIEKYAPDDTVVGLVGSKCDKKEDRSVTEKDLDGFAKDHGCEMVVETSAKDNVNVRDCFNDIATKIAKARMAEGKGKSKDVVMGPRGGASEEEKKKGGCC
eukprot:CAMPEP_0201532874 /NCGR_PEP_ID=MMETSP0161_2-20130828/51520_1 /ASSEMBLY_ACC=CAM_ASM_000251 /TAXON_ID=180227 /ORGANISM="Neoparamoeba aestuarina, Strain SoJaBio B1-5/56/2" /LENGTH=205 /DNA_ID=CAMNT_0047936531 /DNA_START=70 /DNA_END=687 /DNA_ORIENTATION=+